MATVHVLKDKSMPCLFSSHSSPSTLCALFCGKQSSSLLNCCSFVWDLMLIPYQQLVVRITVQQIYSLQLHVFGADELYYHKVVCIIFVTHFAAVLSLPGKPCH